MAVEATEAVEAPRRETATGTTGDIPVESEKAAEAPVVGEEARTATSSEDDTVSLDHVTFR